MFALEHEKVTIRLQPRVGQINFQAINLTLKKGPLNQINQLLIGWPGLFE
jgi:hypothetical protein